MAMESIGGSAGGQMGITTAADEFLNQVHMYQKREHELQLQKNDYENTREINKQMASLAQQARQQNMSDIVTGARNAGLSPLAALGQAFSPPSGGSAGSHGSTMSPSRVLNSAGQLASLAQAGLLNAERERTDIVNKRMRSEDNTLSRTFNQFTQEIFAREASGEEVDPVQLVIAHALDSMEMNEVLDSGTLKGLENYLNYYGLNYQVLADNMENITRRLIEKELAHDKGIPKAHANYIKRSALKLQREINNIVAHTTLLRSQKQLTDQQVAEVKKQIEHLEQSIRSMQDSDDVWLWENNRLGFWVRNSTIAAQGAINGISGGVGFGFGARMMRGAEKAVESHVNQVKRKDYTQSNQSKYLPQKNIPRKYSDLRGISEDDFINEQLDNTGGW